MFTGITLATIMTDAFAALGDFAPLILVAVGVGGIGIVVKVTKRLLPK